MAWKFLNIGKANARIDELESQLSAVSKERDEAKSVLESNYSEISAHAEDIQKELETRNSELAALKSSVLASQTEVSNLRAELKSKDGEVEIKVARQLQQHQSALGQPSAPVVPTEAKKPAAALVGMARLLAHARADLDSAGYVKK